jgi:hypothetical protein
MNIRSLPTNIEIAFWSVVISLLTDSEVIQDFVRKCYICMKSGRCTYYLRMALVTSAAGLLLGTILGLLGL